MTVRVSINGFGRIGRNILRAIIESGRDDIIVVLGNLIGDVVRFFHLFFCLVGVKNADNAATLVLIIAFRK